MLRPRVSLLLLLAACGPGDVAVATNEPDTTASTGQPTSETTVAPTTADSSTSDAPTSAAASTSAPDPSTSDASTSTTDPTTGPVEPGTTTVDTTSTGDTTSTDTTSVSDTDAADVEYAAFFWAGGLDHIMIHRADFTHDRCTTVHLAGPGGPQPELAITAPDGYAAQNAQVAAGVDGCLAGMPTGDVVAAASGSGVVGWSKGPQEYCPLQLDVDITLEFPVENMPWVPAQELLQAVALTVQNCP